MDSPAFAAICLEMVAPTQSVADADLIEIERSYPQQVHVHRDVAEMVPLMQQCDLALSAGGTTLYELCAVGVPRLTYVLASNQREIVEEMSRQEQAVNLGPISELHAEAVVQTVAELIGNFEKRERMSRKGRELVDGRGADRVVKAVGEVVAAAGGGT